MTDDSLPGKPIELPRVALSLANLSLVGFSLVLFAQMVWLEATLRTSFALHNLLGVQPRRVLLLAIAAGVVLPALVTLVVLWLRRPQSTMAEALERVATFCAPLAVLFLVPGLFLSQVAEAKPLFYLIVLVAFSLAFQLLLGKALDAAPRLPRLLVLQRLAESVVVRDVLRALPFAVLVACAGWYALVLGRYAIAHHRLIQTAATDVGVVDNMMSNLLHGRWFRAPAAFGSLPGSYLSLHAEYGALLFVPIYRLRPGAETLLWLQIATAAAAVIPLYLLVAARLGRLMAFWFGAAYLLLAPLHGALLDGFSWLPAVILFSFTLYYAVETERRWLLFLSLPLLLASSEAGPLNALAFGVFLIVSGKRTRLGIALCALSSTLVAFNVVRSMRGVGAVEHPQLLAAIRALLENPVYFVLDLARAVKLTSVLHALAPFCLLPLFELVTWPLFIPALLFTSATTEFWPTTQLGYGSGVIWIPACLFALLITLDKQHAAGNPRSAYLAWVMTLSIAQLSHSFDFGALLRTDGFGGQSTPASFRMTPVGQKRYERLMNLVRRIPASASVAATSSLLPHVSNRQDAYELSRPFGLPDYILLNSTEVGAVRHSLEEAFATRQYQLVASGKDEFYLFSRGAENAATVSALKKLGFREN